MINGLFLTRIKQVIAIFKLVHVLPLVIEYIIYLIHNVIPFCLVKFL